MAGWFSRNATPMNWRVLCGRCSQTESCESGWRLLDEHASSSTHGRESLRRLTKCINRCCEPEEKQFPMRVSNQPPETHQIMLKRNIKLVFSTNALMLCSGIVTSLLSARA